MKSGFLGFAGAVLLGGAGAAHAAVVYDAVADFSSTNGGTSPWSYAYNDTPLFAARTNLDEYVPGFVGFPDLTAWHNAGSSVPNSVIIGKNESSSNYSYETIVQPPNYLNEDPEQKMSVDLVFTAPSSGFYNVSYSFLGIDTQAANNGAGHPVDVLQNGLLLGTNQGYIPGYGASFGNTFRTYLGSGETLDFQTRTGATFAYLSTGVNAMISPVPLPAALPLFGVGLAGLGLAGYGVSRRRVTRPA